MTKRMLSTLKAVKSGVYQRLKNDEGITKAVNGVFDEPHGRPKFPYIIIGHVNGNRYGTKQSAGQEVSQTIHTWSDYRGDLEVLSIHPLIVEAISREPIDIGEGLYIMLSRLETEEVLKNPDNRTRQGILIFNFTVMEV